MDEQARRSAFTGLLRQLMEFCPRCGAQVIEMHQSAWCPVCKWKEGCCEGAPSISDADVRHRSDGVAYP